jgi:hypothetical protein
MGDQEPIFQVGNKHAANCGEPPHVDGNEKGRYYGYFENEHGEQAVFVYDRQTQAGTLWMGDVGWERPIPVNDGVARDIVLNDLEALWLRACWSAATTFTKSKDGK